MSKKFHGNGSIGVLVVLVVLEVPGPEIRILREISSPEPAGNVREASGIREKLRKPVFEGFQKYFLESSGKIPGKLKLIKTYQNLLKPINPY